MGKFYAIILLVASSTVYGMGLKEVPDYSAQYEKVQQETRSAQPMPVILPEQATSAPFSDESSMTEERERALKKRSQLLNGLEINGGERRTSTIKRISKPIVSQPEPVMVPLLPPPPTMATAGSPNPVEIENKRRTKLEKLTKEELIDIMLEYWDKCALPDE